VIQDDGKLIRKGWIVRPAIWYVAGRGDLTHLDAWRPSPPRVVRPAGGTDQESPRPLIGGGPNEITDPLEAEHRVVNVEGQHR